MTLFRFDRSDRKNDALLVWKVRLFAAGAAMGLAGIFLDQRYLIWGAIGILVVGFALRFFKGSAASGSEQ